MGNHLPSTIGLAINIPFQLLLLAGLFSCCLRDLQSCCGRKGRTAAALLAGIVVVMLLRLAFLLITDDGTFGTRCRAYCNSALPDCFWITIDFLGYGLLGFGGLGLIVTWLATRYLRGGIRPDKTTATILGILVGLAVGAIVEYSQVAGGYVRTMNSSRLVLCSFLGGFLALVSRPFLFRKGRFQFGLKNLFALTAVWALIFGLLSPQWSQHRAETEAMSSLATLLGGPVRCTRIEGLAGLARVNSVDLPPGKIDDAKLDAVIVQLKRLSRLNIVNTKTAILSQSELKRLESALPGVHFGNFSSSMVNDREEEVLPDTKQSQPESKSRGG
jgi:hypothetical protein